GSTSCGFKIFRVQILYENARRQVLRLIQPHGVFIPYYNHKPIPASVNSAVMTFFFVFFVCFIVLSVLLSAFGLDFITAASGAGSALANVGPGLGPVIGPNGTFQSLPDGAKWLLSAAMLLGRLELLSVLVLFSARFWRS
ncbi:MAG: potassium transporter TrkG, partial [Alphaproteobacteria bacterium]|nr:potassium transporter TrkG [Alphaproteobacteria bacterium]